MNTTAMVAIIGLYLSVLLAIGALSYRVRGNSPEDYFLANRALGTLVLLMAVYATNMTAFYMMGIPGQAYQTGIGVYGLVAFGTALVTPAVIYLIGYRAWLVGKKYGYMTPAEVFAARWESPGVAVALFVLLVIYTIPYLVTAIVGAGTAVESLSGGALGFTGGAVGVVVVTTLYTATSGMRGTAWTNVFQGFLFMTVGVVTFILLGRALGGMGEATSAILETNPQLLQKGGNFTPQEWFSYLFISPLAVIAFPQVFVRVLAGKRAGDLKRLAVLYPLLVLLTWPPVIYVGLWGRRVFPGLEGQAVDSILPLMAAHLLPDLVVTLVLVAILAAVMSSMDAMLLTISQMVARDLVQRLLPGLSGKKVVWLGRVFVWLVAAGALVAALVRPGTIFTVATFAFTGFALLTPVMLAGLHWRRSNKYGALAGLAVGGLLLPLNHFTGFLRPLQWGFYPVIPLLVITIGVLVLVTLVTPPPPGEATARFFDLFDQVYGRKVKPKGN